MGYCLDILGRGSQVGDMRSAVRFPLRLPVAVKVEAAERTAETGDISAGGVLFYVDENMAVGSSIEFSIVMPAQVLGAEVDVQVKCEGRVVRSFDEDGRHAIAAVIDEYRFQRS